MDQSDPSARAVARGGPMDGATLHEDANPAEFEVSMTDGSRWRYLRTDFDEDADGVQARIYRCAGRV